MFLDEKGNNVYDQMKRRLGWLGYKQLENALELGKDTEYLTALQTMVSSNEPNEDDYDKAVRAVWENYPEAVCNLAEAIRDVFEPFEGYRIDKYPGSYSVKETEGAKITVIKIIPKPKGVFVGLRSDYFTKSLVETMPSLKQVKLFGKMFLGIQVPIGMKDIREIKESSPIATVMKLIQHFALTGTG